MKPYYVIELLGDIVVGVAGPYLGERAEVVKEELEHAEQQRDDSATYQIVGLCRHIERGDVHS
jgi:hypothetical protein